MLLLDGQTQWNQRPSEAVESANSEAGRPRCWLATQWLGTQWLGTQWLGRSLDEAPSCPRVHRAALSREAHPDAGAELGPKAQPKAQLGWGTLTMLSRRKMRKMRHLNPEPNPNPNPGPNPNPNPNPLTMLLRRKMRLV